MIGLRPVFLVAILCSLLVPSACAVDAGDDGPAAEGEGEGEDDDDGDPALPSCEDNEDCRGGELCVDDVCREVCDEDDDCDSAFYTRCDVEVGFCAQCASDTHCDDDEACVEGRCVFFCGDDDDCTGDEACIAGSCVEVECRDDGDCDGGFVCTDGACVSILPVICEAESTRCASDTSTATCDSSGTRETTSECDDGEACIDGDDGARCAAIVCTPNDFGCDDDSTAYVCDGSGTQRELLACRADQYCDAGACRTRVCTPSSVACAGDSLVVCDDTGSATTIESCADDCDAASGCGCRVVDGRGACFERICSPGIGQCVGNGVRVCNAQGTGFASVVDCGADDCTEGRCLPNACTPNATVCSGDTLLTCESDGTGYRATTCAETCSGDDGAARCADQVCVPRATRCDADGSDVLVCNDRGSAELSVPCADGFCVDGACRPEVCEPGTRRCASSTTALVCDARGSSETSEACTGGDVCEDGVCIDETCEPACTIRECGIESRCGTSCGTCTGGEVCNATGRCVAPTTSGRVLRLVTTWSVGNGVDFDTYLSRTPANEMCDADTCSVATCADGGADRPDWDGSGGASAGDPVGVFSVDGEETITLTLPTTTASYRIGLYFDAQSSSTTTTSVRVRAFVDDVEVDSATKTVQHGDLWDGTTLSWNGTRLTMNDATRTQADFVCSANPGSCTADSECPAGEYCSGGNFLFPGTCAVGCRADNECSGALVCNNGTCVAAGTGGVGDACDANTPCASPLFCGLLTGTCVERCESETCVFPGFFGCCELTAAERGTASCSSLGTCQ